MRRVHAMPVCPRTRPHARAHARAHTRMLHVVAMPYARAVCTRQVVLTFWGACDYKNRVNAPAAPMQPHAAPMQPPCSPMQPCVPSLHPSLHPSLQPRLQPRLHAALRPAPLRKLCTRGAAARACIAGARPAQGGHDGADGGLCRGGAQEGERRDGARAPAGAHHAPCTRAHVHTCTRAHVHTSTVHRAPCTVHRARARAQRAHAHARCTHARTHARAVVASLLTAAEGLSRADGLSRAEGLSRAAGPGRHEGASAGAPAAERGAAAQRRPPLPLSGDDRTRTAGRGGRGPDATQAGARGAPRAVEAAEGRARQARSHGCAAGCRWMGARLARCWA